MKYDPLKQYQENMAFAIHHAKMWLANTPPQYHEDLYAEARFALWQACTKYDPDKGFKFCTYADFVIRGVLHKFYYRFIVGEGIDNEISLQTPIPSKYEGKELTLEDTLGYEVDFEDEVILRELKKSKLLHMYYIQDMSQREMAKHLGCNQVFVSRHLKRETERLRNKLGHEKAV
jgi:RNA polymerase sigma factor (sigma-70 family)